MWFQPIGVAIRMTTETEMVKSIAVTLQENGVSLLSVSKVMERIEQFAEWYADRRCGDCDPKSAGFCDDCDERKGDGDDGRYDAWQ
jgi:hypothetical protein